MERIEGEAEERPMDLEPSTSVEEVNLEGLHLDSNTIPSAQPVSYCSKKRKPQENSLDLQDQNSSNESSEREEMLKKRKIEDAQSIQEQMTLKQATDELDLMCKIWVMELRRLPLDQQLFARKAVCDVLFEARLGQLNKDSVRINRSDVVQNYLTCVHEEQGKICACPNGWEQPQQRCPTSSLQLYPGHSQCYSKGTWKGNLSSPHRPPFFATYSNRFVAPNAVHYPYPRGPRIGRPIVITTALNNITTTTIVVVTPRMISATAPSASFNNQVVTAATPGPSRINTLNVSPYRVETSTNTSISTVSSTNTSISTITTTNTPTYTTNSHAAPPPSAPSVPSLNNTQIHIPNTASRSVASTSSSIPPNSNNQAASHSEPIVTSLQSTKPTVNTSTTPTVNTLCDVRMDTVTTDN
ncbi:transcription initiation factor TFIID subunit 12 [Halyomorpha halys]|uniref:transcription initiation factor TFIID subunit 12 n=1 Tax=Halyomorpha halys TaxID=286706 RepID=UPI0006D4FDC6|nr:mucin-2-like [Halyomorpha halys]